MAVGFATSCHARTTPRKVRGVPLLAVCAFKCRAGHPWHAMKYSTSIPDACGRAFMRFHVMQYHPHQIIASVYAGSVRPQLWMQGRDDEKNGSDLKRRGTMRVADRVAHVLPTCMRAHLLTHAPRIHSSVSLDMHAPCRHHAPRILSFCVAVTGLGGIMKNARRGDGRYRMIHVWAVGRRVQSCAYVCVVRLMQYSASRQCIQSCTICVYVPRC